MGKKRPQEILPESSDGSLKHLRTGIALKATDMAALVGLLIAKGIITAIVDEAERENKRYEERLSERLGKPVTLG